MKTLKEILEYKGGDSCNFLDSRDKARLTNFFPVKDWAKLGFTLKEGGKAPKPLPLTKKNVLNKLKGDLNFAFEKALNKRGISSSLMWDVIKMWMWVLEDDELYAFEDYENYGLPLYKAVALKYGFENPIGDNKGNEYEYSDN